VPSHAQRLLAHSSSTLLPSIKTGVEVAFESTQVQEDRWPESYSLQSGKLDYREGDETWGERGSNTRGVELGGREGWTWGEREVGTPIKTPLLA